MTSPAISTIIKMMELLPEPAQVKVADHLREYLDVMQDELAWDKQFKETQPQLIAAAQRAKKEIAMGLSQPMREEQL